MYLECFLASFPEVLKSRDLARIFGCSSRTASRLCHDRHLVAGKVRGEWCITREDLLSQVSALRSPPIPPVLRLVAEQRQHLIEA